MSKTISLRRLYRCITIRINNVPLIPHRMHSKTARFIHMKGNRSITTSLLGLVLLVLPLSIVLSQDLLQLSDPESVGMDENRLKRINQQMHSLVDSRQLSGVQTAVVRKGKLVHFDTYGYADFESATKLTDEAIWRIYSMTKPIVSVALMMLYEEGKFQLNDLVESYIPAFKDLTVHIGQGKIQTAKNKMQVIDLLRHTSGLGYGWGSGYVDSLYQTINQWSQPTIGDAVKKLSTLPLYYEPSMGWQYSVATDVCGYLIEILSGQSLDKFLEERIFVPLKMADTHFEVPREKVSRFITNYTTGENGVLKPLDHPSDSRYTKKVTMFSGGGGLVSTSRDYLRFCQMLINKGNWNGHRILSPKTIELMVMDHTDGITHAGGPISIPGDGLGFGLGFSVTRDLAATQIIGSEGSYGWGGAAGTFFRIDPEEDLIMLMMIQLMPYNHLNARQKFQTMVYQAIVK